MDLHPARAAVLGFGRVRAHRLAAGMSQPELSRRSRVGPKFIGQIERGTSNRSLVTMVVADALACSLTDLLQPEKSAAYVSLRVDDARRVQEAAAVITAVLAPRANALAALANTRLGLRISAPDDSALNPEHHIIFFSRYRPL
jgi:transcriptional regulator with XRE-family HTH domain